MDQEQILDGKGPAPVAVPATATGFDTEPYGGGQNREERLRVRLERAEEAARRSSTAYDLAIARLRGLRELTQMSTSFWSDEALLRHVFSHMAKHLPLECIAVCDAAGKRIASLSRAAPERSGSPGGGEAAAGDSGAEDGLRFARAGTEAALSGYESLLAEADPATVLQTWLERTVGIDTGSMAAFVFPHVFWDQPKCTVGFYLESGFTAAEADREFLDLCGYRIAFEWERSKLFLDLAHHASLGNIAAELSRNSLQPLTAIRTAAELLSETATSQEAAEGMDIIRRNVDWLRQQTQEFRKLSLLREDAVETVRLDKFIDQALEVLSVTIQNRMVTVSNEFAPDCECVLINGAALARTFLDLILGALRAVDVGGRVILRLRAVEGDRIAFEMSHNGRQTSKVTGSSASALPLIAGAERIHPMLQLAERTVHGCGGTLTIEQEGSQRGTLHMVFPRNVSNLRAPWGSLR